MVLSSSALLCAGMARAEQSTLPAGSVPWSDPAHNTPLEQTASTFASQIAQRPVRVQCHGESEWASLGLPSGAAGVVRYQYNPSTGTIVWTEDIAHVREAQCGVLQRFGESAQKPTRCATTQTVTRTVYERVKVPKRVWSWKKVRLKNGHTKRIRKSKWIYVWKTVPRRVTEQVPGPSVPCYGSGGPLPADYRAYAFALEVVVHESIHLFDDRVGAPVQTQASAESRAECYGMQALPAWAVALGADVDDARAIAKYYWDVVYPTWGPGSPYWRPDCVPNGPLDATPNDGFWPVTAEPVEQPIGALAWGYQT